VTCYIEHDFPIAQLNPLAQREANAKRAIAMLHKWWARRVGCVFRTIILASLIPDQEVQAEVQERCRVLGRGGTSALRPITSRRTPPWRTLSPCTLRPGSFRLFDDCLRGREDWPEMEVDKGVNRGYNI